MTYEETAPGSYERTLKGERCMKCDDGYGTESVESSFYRPGMVIRGALANTAAKPYSAVTLEEVIAHRRQVFDESTALIAKKGADYNRDQQKDGDTLFNLRVAALLGIVETPEQGILTRMSDKFMRLISLMKPGREPENRDEPVRSTVHDLHNYLDYALLLWERGRVPAQAPFGLGKLTAELPEKGLDTRHSETGHLVKA